MDGGVEEGKYVGVGAEVFWSASEDKAGKELLIHRPGETVDQGTFTLKGAGGCEAGTAFPGFVKMVLMKGDHKLLEEYVIWLCRDDGETSGWGERETEGRKEDVM